MKEATRRGLDAAVKYALGAPEFDRIRLFLQAEASADKPEDDQVILFVCDAVRDHLLAHNKAVKAVALSKKAV